MLDLASVVERVGGFDAFAEVGIYFSAAAQIFSGAEDEGDVVLRYGIHFRENGGTRGADNPFVQGEHADKQQRGADGTDEENFAELVAGDHGGEF